MPAPAQPQDLYGSGWGPKKIAVFTKNLLNPAYAAARLGADRIAAQFGYPVMLKAAAGGGGKGMRLVHEPGQIRDAFLAASAEADAAFGDAGMYLEKAVVDAHHIEIQVMGDGRGGGLILGERECSIQRRHQKLIEEAPSPVVDANTRARMAQAALNLVRHAGYRNAGTVEFIFDLDTRAYYFLEVNTRIQVEHPVTEMVTGLDLVEWQLREIGRAHV